MWLLCVLPGFLLCLQPHLYYYFLFLSEMENKYMHLFILALQQNKAESRGKMHHRVISLIQKFEGNINLRSRDQFALEKYSACENCFTCLMTWNCFIKSKKPDRSRDLSFSRLMLTTWGRGGWREVIWLFKQLLNVQNARKMVEISIIIPNSIS